MSAILVFIFIKNVAIADRGRRLLSAAITRQRPGGLGGQGLKR
jgi:hypothetical protein